MIVMDLRSLFMQLAVGIGALDIGCLARFIAVRFSLQKGRRCAPTSRSWKRFSSCKVPVRLPKINRDRIVLVIICSELGVRDLSVTTNHKSQENRPQP